MKSENWGRLGGTTSACAENTTAYKYPHLLPGNYLRVRGEYFVRFCPTQATVELPPRARRIPIDGLQNAFHVGTTSACAENTAAGTQGLIAPWNYLRVRGEYFGLDPEIAFLTELPPRARRIQTPHHTYGLPCGTTSACAENTLNELGLL